VVVGQEMVRVAALGFGVGVDERGGIRVSLRGPAVSLAGRIAGRTRSLATGTYRTAASARPSLRRGLAALAQCWHAADR
jgi:hypothetical protein